MAAFSTRLKDKVAIVTASTAGIGLAIAERFLEEGAKVVISSRKRANVEEVVNRLKAKGGDVVGTVCHVANSEHRKNLVKLAVEKFGRIDILVSNAAVNPGVAPILDMPESQVDKILEVNIKAAILLVQDAQPHLSDGGNVIFISSIAGFRPLAPLGVYGVSKTALLGLTKGLATELAPNIRVNCVAPGTVPTNFAEALVSSESAKEAMEEITLLKRLGKPEEIAAAVAFLASDDASYITGETLVVAGGMQSRL